jgi:hypothetical protein
VGIDRFGVCAPRGGCRGWAAAGFDGFVPENDQGGHGWETAGERLVAAGVANAANDVLAAKLFQIISGVAGTAP